MSENTKPTEARGHEESRKFVCSPCGKKISGKDIRELNEKQVFLIKQYVNADFDN